MNTSQTGPAKPNQSTQSLQLVTASQIPIENPSAWMRDGYSPTEILLAAAILNSFAIAGVATVIVAITGLVKTLVDGTPTKRKTK